MTNILTRIRVKSAQPLPEFRAWIPIPQGVETIGNLKVRIAESIQTTRNINFEPHSLVLELEDYELLDGSPVNLLRESDVILIKLELTCPSKRKAEQQDSSPSLQPKRRRLSTSSSPSSNSTPSSSTSSSASSSGSSASSSTSSGSDSDTTDSSARVSPIKKYKQDQNHVKSINPFRRAVSDTVPPGMGKPSTHSRNRRRKIKRQYSKQQAQNKFQNNMATEGVRKENVAHDELPFFPTHPPASLQDPSTTFENSTKPDPTPFLVTLVPPSERPDLPSNIIVTSVDVEDDTYQRHSALEVDTQDEGLTPELTPDWAAVDKDWNMYTEVTASTPLAAGMMIGWKAFGLDPVTLTPEASLLHLGKIIEGSSDNVRIAVLSRGSASFGRVIVDEEPEEELEKSKGSMILEKWRIIDQSG